MGLANCLHGPGHAEKLRFSNGSGLHHIPEVPSKLKPTKATWDLFDRNVLDKDSTNLLEGSEYRTTTVLLLYSTTTALVEYWTATVLHTQGLNGSSITHNASGQVLACDLTLAALQPVVPQEHTAQGAGKHHGATWPQNEILKTLNPKP